MASQNRALISHKRVTISYRVGVGEKLSDENTLSAN